MRNAQHDIIEQRYFSYVRVGYDQRVIELLPDHRIGVGQASCERRWALRWTLRGLTLQLEGDEGIICTLRRDSSDGWRGRWSKYERMPVRLTPCAVPGEFPEELHTAASEIVRGFEQILAESREQAEEPSFEDPRSQVVTHSQVGSRPFERWRGELRLEEKHRRKSWEFCYIMQCLERHQLLGPGRKGLGFGVGHEQLPALMAKYGCTVLATDLHHRQATVLGWDREKNGDARRLHLNKSRICPPDLFEGNVRFRWVDMNRIDRNLKDGSFDFIWSACALEHLGSLSRGRRFIFDSLACLRPGGVAVHTTEYNVSSYVDTEKRGPCVLFRRRDIEEIVIRLRRLGHRIDFNPHLGGSGWDARYDLPPFDSDHSLKLLLGRHISTSLGLLIVKGVGPT